MKKIVKVSFAALLAVAVLMLVATVVSSRYLHRWSNTAILAPPYDISPAARALHDTLLIADLHIDSAVHLVDFSRPQTDGHVGWDRLEAGGLSLMTLSLPTEVSLGGWRGVNGMAIGGIVNGQPADTWFSNFRRGEFFRAHIENVVVANSDRMLIVRTQDDLRELAASWSPGGDRRLGILIAVEGIHILDSDIDLLQPLIDSGIRMISLTHAFDNEAAGSNTGTERGGLTTYGREALEIIERNGVVLDLAHLSEQAAIEALDIVTKPVVISHTGVRGTCDKDRNVSDEVIRRVAESGGVVGIGVFRSVLCGENVNAIVRAMDHVRMLVGVDHIAIGSDFDGAVKVIFDVAGLPLLTDKLLTNGYNPEEVRMIMGGNVIRVLSQTLPRATVD